jgi:hypothetical protein
MKWAGHVALMGEMRHAHKIWMGDLKERDHLKDIDIDERIILERILGKWGGKVWTVCIWLSIGTSGGLL